MHILRAIGTTILFSTAALWAMPSRAQTFTMLYGFDDPGLSGSYPEGALVYRQGALYGVTNTGGTGGQNSYGDGTVFTFDLQTGVESLLHEFSGNDGLFPTSGLTDRKEVLYGEVASGGAYGYGLVYSIPSAGAPQQTILHSFTGDADGGNPSGGLLDIDGKLYGVTRLGGSHGEGVLFRIDAVTGAETVLYNFPSGLYDFVALGGLTYYQGSLYGLALGATSSYGIVYEFDLRSGQESTVYTFTGGGDGGYPVDRLRQVDGLLYGLTSSGGANGLGVVFAVDPAAGNETVLHSFAGGADPSYFLGGLMDYNGYLYGTSSMGGAYNMGTLFSVCISTGFESLVHSFSGNDDGAFPASPLIHHGGTFYGTTSGGGPSYVGTIFSFTPG